MRNLVLEGARSAEGNAAGIRSEGARLLVDRVAFLDNQNGILGGLSSDAEIAVSNSRFVGNGDCRHACAHAIYAGHIAALSVRNSQFFGTREGHHIKSRALLTTIDHCDIADGPAGTASYAVDIPNGGSLVIRNSRLEKGPHTGNARGAVMIGEEGELQPTQFIRLENFTFQNDSGRPSSLLVNLTAVAAQVTPAP